MKLYLLKLNVTRFIWHCYQYAILASIFCMTRIYHVHCLWRITWTWSRFQWVCNYCIIILFKSFGKTACLMSSCFCITSLLSMASTTVQRLFLIILILGNDSIFTNFTFPLVIIIFYHFLVNKILFSIFLKLGFIKTPTITTSVNMSYCYAN